LPSIRLPVLLLLLLWPGFAPAGAAAVDPAEYDEAISTIRCDCGCHPQSVKDCACGRAAQMREEIQAQMAGDPSTGRPAMNAAGLIAWYVERQGEQIRISPAATGFNLLAWLGPLVALLVASVVLVALIRRWHGQRPAVPAPAEGPPLPGDDPYLRRLNRQLEELE